MTALARDHSSLLRISEAAHGCFGAIQKPEELSQLLRLLEDLRPSRVLEIGTYTGGMLWALSRVCPDDTILVSVDDGTENLRHHRPLSSEAIRRADQRVVLVKGDSHSPETANRVREEFSGEPVDLLFIDGDHSYAGVRDDFLMYSQLVRVGGLIAFHDIVEHPSHVFCEVAPFWQKLAASSCATREILASDHVTNNCCGIGVVEVAPEVFSLSVF